MSAMTEPLDPRDLLVHLRHWLRCHRENHTRHFGDSDPSGHPHGYAGVVIPEWDVRQRLDEIEASIQASGTAAEPCEVRTVEAPQEK